MTAAAGPGETIPVSGAEARGLLDRVTIRYAPDDAIKSAHPAPGARPAGNGVWTEAAGELTDVSVLLEIHNGFDSPLTMVGIKLPAAEAPGQASLTLFCELNGTEALAAGETRAAMCRGSERTERVGEIVKGLAERKTPTPLPANSFYSLAGNVYSYPAPTPVEPGAARSRPTVEPPRESQAPSWKRHSQLVLAILSLASFVIAGIAASRVDDRDVQGGVVSGLAAILVLGSAFALLVANLAVKPGSGYEVLIGIIALYYGAIPFFIALICVTISILSGNATRFRTFAAWFGGLAFVSVMAALQVSG